MELPAVRESDGLARALKTARSAGDLDGQIVEVARRIDAEKKDCRTTLKRAGLWSGEPDQLPELPLPLLETVRKKLPGIGLRWKNSGKCRRRSNGLLTRQKKRGKWLKPPKGSGGRSGTRPLPALALMIRYCPRKCLICLKPHAGNPWGSCQTGAKKPGHPVYPPPAGRGCIAQYFRKRHCACSRTHFRLKIG